MLSFISIGKNINTENYHRRMKKREGKFYHIRKNVNLGIVETKPGRNNKVR